MISQCPPGIAQQLPYHAITVPTAMQNRVTKTMSVALPLGNNWRERSPTLKPSSTSLILISSGYLPWTPMKWLWCLCVQFEQLFWNGYAVFVPRLWKTVLKWLWCFCVQFMKDCFKWLWCLCVQCIRYSFIHWAQRLHSHKQISSLHFILFHPHQLTLISARNT